VDTKEIDLGFEIPPDRIAQHPCGRRDGSLLLVLRRGDGRIEPSRFDRIAAHLPAGCLLVMNDTKVVPCRLVATKSTGGRVELLLLEWLAPEGDGWTGRALLRGAPSRPAASPPLRFGEIAARVRGRRDDGAFDVLLRADGGGDVRAAFARAAAIPLPPYIRRPAAPEDTDRYQTVYARRAGSVAAHTAGLHFTGEILARVAAAGIEVARVTLHIGPGTFTPIRSARLEDHRMQREEYAVTAAAARAVARARAQGRPVVAVGTSCVRTLEGIAAQAGGVRAGRGSTELFIRPGHAFRVVDGMVTNFHTPRSAPLSMVCALAGVGNIGHAYRAALDGGYRFYSYGDSMLILP